jgi:hypothetical protein
MLGKSVEAVASRVGIRNNVLWRGLEARGCVCPSQGVSASRGYRSPHLAALRLDSLDSFPLTTVVRQAGPSPR